MAKNNEELENLKKVMGSRMPSLVPTASKLKMVYDNKVMTAETDGKTVYFSPEFMKGLTFEEKVAVMTHETMHVCFNHIERSVNKNHNAWNKATEMMQRICLPKRCMTFT